MDVSSHDLATGLLDLPYGVMPMMEKIMALAERGGITQADLARVASVAPARLTDWKQGKGKPSIMQAMKIARALDVTLDYLADDDADQPVGPPGLSDIVILETVRALKLDMHEAIRRLHNPATGITQPKPLPTEAETHSRSKGRAG